MTKMNPNTSSLGHTRTQDLAGGPGCMKEEQVSPLAKSNFFDGLDSEMTMSVDEPGVIPSNTSSALKSSFGRTISRPMRLSPSPMITRSRNKHHSTPTGTPNAKKEANSKVQRVAKRKSPVQANPSVKPELRTLADSLALIHSNTQGSFDGTTDDSTKNRQETPDYSKHPSHVRSASDATVEPTSEAELEIERGASNLWSILQTADASNTDDDESAFGLNRQNKAPKAKNGSQNFFSTVLNHPIPATNSEVTTNGFTTDNHSDAVPEKGTSVIDFPSTAAKPTTTSPPTIAPAPQTPSPQRLCKTTGKPFNPHTTVRSTPRKRAPPLAEYVSDQTAIPTSWENVSEADKNLMQMKEAGKTWEAIRQMWKDVTGQEVAASTLPNRYNRLRGRLLGLAGNEHMILLQSVTEVEKSQRAEKWARVSAVMHTRGGGKYSAEYLQKQFSALK